MRHAAMIFRHALRYDTLSLIITPLYYALMLDADCCLRCRRRYADTIHAAG